MRIKKQKTNLKSHPHRYWWAMIALFGVMISGISVDLNVPSLPAVAEYFRVDKGLSQLTVTAYLLGFGLFQLVAGTVCDSVGRKKPLMIALCGYILTNFLAPFSQDIYQLLALRFFQGVTVAFCSVAMRAIIPDLFEGAAFKRMANYMTMAWSIGPIIAPAIGGYLQAYFNWPGPFYFLMIYASSLLIFIGLFVPETLPTFSTFTFKKMVTDSVTMISHKTYVLCMIYTGLFYSVLLLFGVASPFLIQNILGYSAIAFGHIALLMGLAWFLGNFSNRLMIDWSPAIKITICLWLMFVVAVIMLICSFCFKINIYNIVIPIFILSYLSAIIFPNYYAKSMSLFPHMSASANALMAASMVLLAAVVTAFVSTLKFASQTPLSFTYLGMVVICLLIYYLTGQANPLKDD